MKNLKVLGFNDAQIKKFHKLESQRSKSLGIQTIDRFEVLRDQNFENLVFSKIRELKDSNV